MKSIKIISIVITCTMLILTSVQAQERGKFTVKSQQFTQAAMVAELLVPQGKKAELFPAILALGGSEGGMPFDKALMDSLAGQGYVVLRLAYFKADSLPEELSEIPLEYFENALAFLSSHKMVDKNKIGVLGASKGAEAALLLASKNNIVKTVVAHVPSNVVWYGLSQNMMESKSSWTSDGEGLSFMPYGKPAIGWQTSRIADYYEAGFEQHPEVESDAAIPVEKIEAPILITSAGMDNIWPSEYMAKKIMDRLDVAQFSFEKVHLNFPESGHLLFAQIKDAEKLETQLNFFGGTLEGTLAAQRESIKATFNFFTKHLKN